MRKADVWLLLFGLAFAAAHMWAWRQDVAARTAVPEAALSQARAAAWPDGPDLPPGWEAVGPVYRLEVDTERPPVIRVAIGPGEALLGWVEGEWVALPVHPGPAGEWIFRAEGWAPAAVAAAGRR